MQASVLPSVLASNGLNITRPHGAEPHTAHPPLPSDAYLQIDLAATQLQAARPQDDRLLPCRSLHYAVIGTPNRLELELGFFVKLGDGIADLKPIAHL